VVEPEIDYRAAFKKFPGATALLSSDLTIMDVCDDYVEAAGRPAEELVGGKILELFPHNPNDPGDTGQRDLRASLERVLASGDRDVIPLTRYDVEEPNKRGSFTERYWAIVNTAVVVGDQVSMIVHRAEEMTHLIHEARKINC
jgi:PAS domain-containing protein